MAVNTQFEWLPEYDGTLEHIASTDEVKTEWTQLRDIIKYKLEKNIALYLSQSNNALPAPLFVSTSRQLPSGGLRLPPFPPRPRDNDHEPPKTILTEAEANRMKDTLYAQLDDLDGAPFTIQRVCELCLHPQKQYKFLGKYLRALERTLLVTSTWDTFPPLTNKHTGDNGHGPVTLGSLPSSSAPSTPMFSPIPFLHDDARRSHSRSPPPSPLALRAVEPGNLAAIMPPAGSASLDHKALGLVDELDDPSPGHLSDHPQPLSSTTTIAAPPAKPLGALGDRFVKSSEPPVETPLTEPQSSTSGGNDQMSVDDPEKENKSA